MIDLDGLRILYANTAFLYESRIVPVIGVLAIHLAQWVIHCVDAASQGRLFDPFDLDNRVSARASRRITVLDVGAGTGILARTLAPGFNRVIAFDLSPDMLGVAGQTSPANVVRLLGDLHHIPLRHASTGLVTSSFGLNASTPAAALRSLSGVLRPGGLLIFQEWGAEDACSRIVNETVDEFAPESIPGIDPALERYLNSARPWYDQLQDKEDYYEALKKAGFELVWVREGSFCTVHMPSINAFLAYKLSWPTRRLALEAMPPRDRDACGLALLERLAPYVNHDGSFGWSPALFRVCAVRGHLP